MQDDKKKVTDSRDADDAVLWDVYWQNPDDGRTLTALLESHMPLVYHVLERVSISLPPHVAIEDLLQSATLGLYHAITRFDPKMGNRFASFAYPRIRGAILDELRQMDFLSRSTRSQLKKVEDTIREWAQEHGDSPDEDDIASELGMRPEYVSTLLSRSQPWLSLDSVIAGGDGDLTLQDVLADTVNRTPDQEAVTQDLIQQMRKAFMTLPAREQKILYLYYYEELRLSEIAVLYELTEARICQLHALAVAKLKVALKLD